MFGAIVGDIAGSVYEFDQIKTKDFELFGDYHGEVCTFTDDTVMTLAVAKALLESRNDCNALSANADKYMHEIGRKYPSCGYGGRFWMWMFLDDPQPYKSYGNGAAMRVSPVAFAASSMEEALFLSDQVTKISHNHPEGIKGSRATTACIFLAKSGKSKQEIREYVQKNYYPLRESLAEIRPDYCFNETCQNTVPQAIQAFLEAADFEDAIRNAISLGGDSDTLAAITGGIAEAFFGVPEDISQKARGYLTPELRNILDEFEMMYQK